VRSTLASLAAMQGAFNCVLSYLMVLAPCSYWPRTLSRLDLGVGRQRLVAFSVGRAGPMLAEASRRTAGPPSRAQYC
jgi:hypothetical protein